MRIRLWLTLIIALNATVFQSAPALSQGKRVALVIGNSAYENTPPLANRKNDADDMAAALQALGFEVIKGVDLKKSDMERSIRDFATALVGAEMGLFFYAGHGLQVSGVNYLVPTDAVLTTASALDFEMVRLDLIQRTMETETQTNVIMLDACRDNPLSRNLARALGTRSASIGRGLGQFEAGVGTLISFSTQPGNVALDGTGRNSPYTGSLVKHLATPAEDLTSVLIRVRNDVISTTASRRFRGISTHCDSRSISAAGGQRATPYCRQKEAPRLMKLRRHGEPQRTQPALPYCKRLLKDTAERSTLRWPSPALPNCRSRKNSPHFNPADSLRFPRVQARQPARARKACNIV